MLTRLYVDPRLREDDVLLDLCDSEQHLNPLSTLQFMERLLWIPAFARMTFFWTAVAVNNTKPTVNPVLHGTLTL